MIRIIVTIGLLVVAVLYLYWLGSFDLPITIAHARARISAPWSYAGNHAGGIARTLLFACRGFPLFATVRASPLPVGI